MYLFAIWIPSSEKNVYSVSLSIFKLHLKKLIFIGPELIYKIVLVSAVPQGESVIKIYTYTIFQILF